MEQLVKTFQNWLSEFGFSVQITDLIKIFSLLVIIAITSLIVDLIAKKVIMSTISRIVTKTKNKWDDIILKQKVFNRLAHFAPALVIHYTINLALGNYPKLVEFIHMSIYIYMTIIAVMVITSFLKALHEIYLHTPISANRPIKGYIQLVNIFVIFIALILVISFVTGSSPNKLLTGLGAMAAVLMLVFKDTILGLVASIQLTANKMVNIGDWVSMPSKGADGTVLEITLNTVKIQNWDKTISTIPTYMLVSDSFANWKGMEESGGRRIKRSVNIDMRSVKFCSPEMLEKFMKINYLQEYIESKTKELEDYNAKNSINNSVLVNGRRLTNIGVFRKYVEMYLKNNSHIHNEMTFLVRHLQPSDKGIPMEIYVFSKDQAWANYESVQADIFDHILAVIPEFELRVFQNPTGFDFENINKQL
ncbi:MAG: mechanosensitive ion channel [Salinivirgaceae bacterium]|nr:mechanosensitive ion channel [Salinivirgaceae bacterium]